MKILKLTLIIAVIGFAFCGSLAYSHVKYEEFEEQALEHQKQIELEGLEYTVGGALGFVSSFALGVTSKEIIPKIGYTLIQTLSLGAVTYGATSYFTGDAFTQEAERLRDFAKELSKISNLTPIQKELLLDESTKIAIHRAKRRKAQTRFVRGILELTAATSSATTMILSKASNSSSSITLGFMVLITTLGGISDLFGPVPSEDAKPETLFTFDPFLVVPNSQAKSEFGSGLLLGYHW